MDRILLCSNHIPLVTSIYNSFIEDYMLDANGSYVKVYLYLAKCIQHGDQGLSISSLADRMENTERDVLRALLYWEKKGLLVLDRNAGTDEITGIDMVIPGLENKDEAIFSTDLTGGFTEGGNGVAEQDTYEPLEDDVQTATVIDITGKQQDLSGDETYCFILNVIEEYLQRPLAAADHELLQFLYSGLEFSEELIIHLYDYCISLGKTSVPYIRQVALNWHGKNITTPEEARAESDKYNHLYNEISRAFGLGRALAPAEKRKAEQWRKDFNMSDELIVEACNITILKRNKADFNYVGGILKKWKEAGVKTLGDVAGEEQSYRANKAKNNAKTAQTKKSQKYVQRNRSSKDYDEMEMRALKKSMS